MDIFDKLPAFTWLVISSLFVGFCWVTVQWLSVAKCFQILPQFFGGVCTRFASVQPVLLSGGSSMTFSNDSFVCWGEGEGILGLIISRWSFDWLRDLGSLRIGRRNFGFESVLQSFKKMSYVMFEEILLWFFLWGRGGRNFTTSSEAFQHSKAIDCDPVRFLALRGPSNWRQEKLAPIQLSNDQLWIKIVMKEWRSNRSKTFSSRGAKLVSYNYGYLTLSSRKHNEMSL